MADGFRVKRIKAELPALKIPKKVMDDVGKIVEGNILDNIRTQRQADGSAIKSNAPSTAERKRRLGRPNLSLVDEFHRFVRGNRGSWIWRATTVRQRAAVEVRPNPAAQAKGKALPDLVRYVQEMGYTGWFAMSDEGRNATRLVFRKWIRAEFRKAAAKSAKGRPR